MKDTKEEAAHSIPAGSCQHRSPLGKFRCRCTCLVVCPPLCPTAIRSLDPNPLVQLPAVHLLITGWVIIGVRTTHFFLNVSATLVSCESAVYAIELRSHSVRNTSHLKI